MRTLSQTLASGPTSIGLGLVLAGGCWALYRLARAKSNQVHLNDPSLLRNNSEIKSYTANRSGITYPGIRVFYRRHPKADQLPKDPAPLPLLVFVHGLAGSVAQFHLLMTSLSNCASCLAIDLPGCGRSRYEPTSWDAYTVNNLADLVKTIITEYLEEDQGYVLVTHDMGSMIANILSSDEQDSHFSSRMMGLVAISPRMSAPIELTANRRRLMSLVPDIFHSLRWAWKRRQDPRSIGIEYVFDSDLETQRLRNKFDEQSRGPVFFRMIWGMYPDVNETKAEPFPGAHIWRPINAPLYLVSGKEDSIVPAWTVEFMADDVAQKQSNFAAICPPARPGGASQSVMTERDAIRKAATDSLAWLPAPVHSQSIKDIRSEDFEEQKHSQHGSDESLEDPTTPREHQESTGLPIAIPPQPRLPPAAVGFSLIAGGHGILFVPTTARIIAGLISDFLETRITARLSLGWQLQYLSREGKWDVKNLAKWKNVQPVSKPINGIFRAMKTLREVDEEHCPVVFKRKWGHVIKDIIDISHAEPVYDPRSFGDGIRYHKFPTVSKIPPTPEEVAGFIELVDRICEDQKKLAQEEGWQADHVIGVHCHYGFNRTGYFVVSYLVERCGFSVQDAIETFAEARPNGIRHSHFLDRLYVTYTGSC